MEHTYPGWRITVRRGMWTATRSVTAEQADAGVLAVIVRPGPDGLAAALAQQLERIRASRG